MAWRPDWTGRGSLYFTDSALSAYIGQLAGPPDNARLFAHQPYFIYRQA